MFVLSVGVTQRGGRRRGREWAAGASQGVHLGKTGKTSWELRGEHLGVARTLPLPQEEGPDVGSERRPQRPERPGPASARPWGRSGEGPERAFSRGASVRAGGRPEEPCVGAWPLRPDRLRAEPLSGADPALEAAGAG